MYLNSNLANIPCKIIEVQTNGLGIGGGGLTAGSYGYANYTPNLLLGEKRKILAIRVQTSNISELHGLQLTPVFINSTSFYFTYYSPGVVSASTVADACWVFTILDMS